MPSPIASSGSSHRSSAKHEARSGPAGSDAGGEASTGAAGRKPGDDEAMGDEVGSAGAARESGDDEARKYVTPDEARAVASATVSRLDSGAAGAAALEAVRTPVCRSDGRHDARSSVVHACRLAIAWAFKGANGAAENPSSRHDERRVDRRERECAVDSRDRKDVSREREEGVSS